MDDFAHGRNITSLPDSVQEFTWKSKLQDLLPEDWKLMDEWASEKANVHDLLSHISGLPRCVSLLAKRIHNTYKFFLDTNSRMAHKIVQKM
jgi:CubicO group peptidase (beta-lactamase class C family)